MRTYVGIFAIDGGGNDLNSRATHPMTFREAADWYKASREYFAMMVKYDCNVHEVTVSVYLADDINSIDAEPLAIERFRPKG